jgi:hypothetical protein
MMFGQTVQQLRSPLYPGVFHDDDVLRCVTGYEETLSCLEGGCDGYIGPKVEEVVAVRVRPAKVGVAEQVAPKVMAQRSGVPIISRSIGGDATPYTGARVVVWVWGLRGRCYPHDTGAESDLRGHELATESVVIVDVGGWRENRPLDHREEGEPLRPSRGRSVIILLGQVNYLIHEDRVGRGGPIVPILSKIFLGDHRKPLIRSRW